MCGSDVCLGLLAIIFPPIAVWVKRGICSVDSIINIALCFLGFLPGLIHAWWIIATTPDPTYIQLPPDAERGDGNITYYYVQVGGPQYRRQDGQPARQPAKPAQQPGYGAVNNTPNAQFPAQQEGFVQPPPAQAGPSNEDEVPPTYQQAVGDNKVQHP